MKRSVHTQFFTVDQWELTRRLKNSGLTKEQICQAYDEIDKIESELGNLYAAPANYVATGSGNTANGAYQQQQAGAFGNNKTNGINGASGGHSGEILCSTPASTIVNNFFARVSTPEQENRELDLFRHRGDLNIHKEISLFVFKHDLKQSQISRMAGVNQAYVSKFLRGEFIDLSENGKTLIYKWYIRFVKSPDIYLKAHNIILTSSSSGGGNDLKSKLSSGLHAAAYANATSTNSTNSSYTDSQKRTRFSFKPEHLTIIEKAFIENQYPDQRKREELARLCNEARPCVDRERVTEQVITHWFQNKRKILKKCNMNDGHQSQHSSSKSNGNSGSNNLIDSNSINYDFLDGFTGGAHDENDDEEDEDDDQEDN